MTALLLIGALVCLYFAWLAWEAGHAPIGYEDEETGFHYGDPPKKGN